MSMLFLPRQIEDTGLTFKIGKIIHFLEVNCRNFPEEIFTKSYKLGKGNDYLIKVFIPVEHIVEIPDQSRDRRLKEFLDSLGQTIMKNISNEYTYSKHDLTTGELDEYEDFMLFRIFVTKKFIIL